MIACHLHIGGIFLLEIRLQKLPGNEDLPLLQKMTVGQVAMIYLQQ